MRVYFTPDFSRKVEIQTKRDQNVSKMLIEYLKTHDRGEIRSQPKVFLHSTNQPNLYILEFYELRFFVSFHTDERGEYMIMVDIEK